jgi:hypothetical protein
LTDHTSLSATSLLAFALVLLVSAGSGCSFSWSSESISDSISSPSEWSRSSSESSSDSSGSGGDDASDDGGEAPESAQDSQTYAEDVAQVAYTYGKQGGDIGSLRNGISGLAMKRGLTNWEVDAVTSQSIGKGVGRAGMSEEAFASFSKELFGGDLTKATELRKGYEAGRPPPAPMAEPTDAKSETGS